MKLPPLLLTAHLGKLLQDGRWQIGAEMSDMQCHLWVSDPDCKLQLEAVLTNQGTELSDISSTSLLDQLVTFKSTVMFVHDKLQAVQPDCPFCNCSSMQLQLTAHKDLNCCCDMLCASSQVMTCSLPGIEIRRGRSSTGSCVTLSTTSGLICNMESCCHRCVCLDQQQDRMMCGHEFSHLKAQHEHAQAVCADVAAATASWLSLLWPQPDLALHFARVPTKANRCC